MEVREGRPQHRAMLRKFRWLCAAVLPAVSAQAQPRITITLYDIAGVGREIREAMKAECSRIFLAAGVELNWVECEVAGTPVNSPECSRPLGPARLMLQLAPRTNKHHPKASGLAVIQNGSGVYACLYPERVMQLAQDAKWDFGDLLGHAAAHELGHLLQGSATHSWAGVMRGNWETEDLRGLSHGGLMFLPGQLRPYLQRLQPRNTSVSSRQLERY